MFNPAFAQDAAAAAPQGTNPLLQLLPFILALGIFYLLIMRPQQRRAREHQQKIDSIQRGDRVITGGGILGTVVRIQENDEITVEIADGVKVNVLKSSIASVKSKGEPAVSDRAA